MAEEALRAVADGGHPLPRADLDDHDSGVLVRVLQELLQPAPQSSGRFRVTGTRALAPLSHAQAVLFHGGGGTCPPAPPSCLQPSPSPRTSECSASRGFPQPSPSPAGTSASLLHSPGTFRGPPAHVTGQGKAHVSAAASPAREVDPAGARLEIPEVRLGGIDGAREARVERLEEVDASVALHDSILGKARLQEVACGDEAHTSRRADVPCGITRAGHSKE